MKARIYARGRVPTYIVVDLERDLVIVHSAPHDLGYEHVETYGKGQGFILDAARDLVFEADAFLSPS